MDNNNSLQQHKPKHLSTVKIIQSPNRQNYSKEEFSVLLGDYCKLASDNNTPFLIELNFLKTDDSEPNSQNLIYRLHLPIFPERYSYEKTLNDYFSYMFCEQLGCSMALHNEQSLLPAFDSYIKSNVRNLPHNIKNHFIRGYDKDFEQLKSHLDGFTRAVTEAFPKNADSVNDFVSTSIKAVTDLEQFNSNILAIAQNKTSVLPFDKDQNQAKRLLDYISYKLAQTFVWAYEDMEEERAEVLQSFKMFDDNYILDSELNGRIAEAVCEITVPILKQFENTLSLSKKPSQPGENN